MVVESIGTPLVWLGFAAVVAVCLALDLGVFHRRAHVVGTREAATWMVVWIAVSLLFNLFVYLRFGPERGLEFLTGYLVEEALSVDNMFVFVLVFATFTVPPRLHHRVLYWGILGAFVMRGFFIGIGTALIQNFHWVAYAFGVLLVYTGISLLFHDPEQSHPERNPIVRLCQRFMPLVSEYEGARFTVRRAGKRYFTPLFLVLVAIEVSDVIFAVDSIPAVFAVTNDPFIVYTSNIFAILGLRAMYFLLARIVPRFEYLRYGLALVLAFIGTKMLAADLYEVPIAVSLAVVAGTIALAVVASMLWGSKHTAVSDEQ